MYIKSLHSWPHLSFPVYYKTLRFQSLAVFLNRTLCFTKESKKRTILRVGRLAEANGVYSSSQVEATARKTRRAYKRHTTALRTSSCSSRGPGTFSCTSSSACTYIAATLTGLESCGPRWIKEALCNVVKGLVRKVGLQVIETWFLVYKSKTNLRKGLTSWTPSQKGRIYHHPSKSG